MLAAEVLRDNVNINKSFTEAIRENVQATTRSITVNEEATEKRKVMPAYLLSTESVRGLNKSFTETSVTDQVTTGIIMATEQASQENKDTPTYLFPGESEEAAVLTDDTEIVDDTKEPSKDTFKPFTPTTTPPPTYPYCETDRYFLQEHELLSSLTKDKKKEYDWYNYKNSILYKYQQAFFFVFTVFGFMFLVTSIKMRMDAVLKGKWSSSFLFFFLLYSISMSLTVRIFALQSGTDGVR